MSKYSLVIGRFQPLHDGHQSLIDKLLGEGKPVCVAVMDTAIDQHNPYTVDQRLSMIKEAYGDKVKTVVIPQISEVCYGRNVGYGINRVRHGMEGVSASKLRGDDPIGKFEDDTFVESYKKTAEKVHHLAASQGFWRKGADRHVCEPIALAHSELSEALECFRMGNPPDKNINDMSGAEVQLSDVLGILMDMEVGYGLEISTALAKKMEFNKTRGHMHGGKQF
jgi:cytidyltransferase-like protein